MDVTSIVIVCGLLGQYPPGNYDRYSAPPAATMPPTGSAVAGDPIYTAANPKKSTTAATTPPPAASGTSGAAARPTASAGAPAAADRGPTAGGSTAITSPPPGGFAPSATTTAQPIDNSPPGNLIREAVVIPQSLAVEGRATPLYEILAYSGDRRRQLDAIHSYWKLACEAAEYHFAWQQTQFLEHLSKVTTQRGGDATVAAEIATRHAAARAQLREAELELNDAQFELAERSLLPTNVVRPLAADLPHVGTYRTQFDKVYAGRTPPARAHLLNRTLPLRKQIIDTRADGVFAAKDAYEAAFEAYSKSQLPVEEVLTALDDFRTRRGEFIAAVRRYNDEIAEYALMSVPEGVPVRTIVGMLIKNPTLPASAAPPTNSVGMAFDEFGNVVPAGFEGIAPTPELRPDPISTPGAGNAPLPTPITTSVAPAPPLSAPTAPPTFIAPPSGRTSSVAPAVAAPNFEPTTVTGPQPTLAPAQIVAEVPRRESISGVVPASAASPIVADPSAATNSFPQNSLPTNIVPANPAPAKFLPPSDARPLTTPASAPIGNSTPYGTSATSAGGASPYGASGTMPTMPVGGGSGSNPLRSAPSTAPSMMVPQSPGTPSYSPPSELPYRTNKIPLGPPSGAATGAPAPFTPSTPYAGTVAAPVAAAPVARLDTAIVTVGHYASFASLTAGRRAQELVENLYGPVALPEQKSTTISLADCLATIGGRDRRLILHDYWTAAELRARYRVWTQAAEQIEGLSQATLRQGDSAAKTAAMLRVRSAKLSAEAERTAALADLEAARWQLTDDLRRPLTEAWVLPETLPHGGGYKTKLEALPASLANSPYLQRSAKRIPILHSALQDRAESVVTAETAAEAVAARYGQQKTAAHTALAAVERLSRETVALLQTTTRYNLTIGDYATAVIPQNAPRDMLVSAMVVPRNAVAARP